MTTYTYIDYEGQIEQSPDHFGQSCEIVAVIPDAMDPVPESDWYRVRFADGTTFPVAPEELDPIPAPGTGR